MPTPASHGLVVPRTPRRASGRRPIALAALLVAATATVQLAPGTERRAAAQSADRVRVLHLTVDALHPSNVGPDTPVLQSLRDSGTWWEQARSVMASETLPNHVAMGTGTYPGRNGIPGNGGRVSPGDTEEADPDLGIPALLDVESLGRAIETECPDLRTIHVFSKVYVDNIFEADPVDVRFPQENFNVPGSGHAFDSVTVPFLVQAIAQGDPDYVFANLGDNDRSGHVDATGFTGEPVGQRAVLQQTDTLIGTLRTQLQAQGLWDTTVLIISSDHSMDWTNTALDAQEALTGTPVRHLDIAGLIEANPTTAGKLFVSENGGAGLVYLNDPDDPDGDAILKALRDDLLAHPGIGEALYREPNPLDPGNDLATVHPAWNLHQTDRAGELFVYAAEDWLVGTMPGPGGPSSNPIPGNHGHVATRHITALVSGGWDGVISQSIAASDPSAIDLADDTEALPEQAEQVDFAPTIGWLLGVTDPGLREGGEAQWQGRVLEEAFSRQPTSVCATEVVEPAPTPTPTETPAPTPTPTPTSDPDPDPLPATGGGLALLGLGATAAAGLLRRLRG